MKAALHTRHEPPHAHAWHASVAGRFACVMPGGPTLAGLACQPVCRDGSVSASGDAVSDHRICGHFDDGVDARDTGSHNEAGHGLRKKSARAQELVSSSRGASPRVAVRMDVQSGVSSPCGPAGLWIGAEEKAYGNA